MEAWTAFEEILLEGMGDVTTSVQANPLDSQKYGM